MSKNNQIKQSLKKGDTVVAFFEKFGQKAHFIGVVMEIEVNKNRKNDIAVALKVKTNLTPSDNKIGNLIINNALENGFRLLIGIEAVEEIL